MEILQTISVVKNFEIRKILEMDAIDRNFWLECDNQAMIVNLSSKMNNTLVEVCGIYQSEIFVGICVIPSLFIKSNEKFHMKFEIDRNFESGNSQIKKLRMDIKDSDFLKLFLNKSSLIDSLLFYSTVFVSIEGSPSETTTEYFDDDFKICIEQEFLSEYLQINLEAGEYFLYGNALLNNKTSLYDTFHNEIAFILHGDFIQDFFNCDEVTITQREVHI